MRGVAVLVVVLAAAVGCGAGESAPRGATTGSATPAGTDLRITVWPRGRDAAQAPQRWTLRCAPAGGTLPRRASACDRLGKLRQPFAPLPQDVVCTDIYGGPQQALVTGRHAGRRVWATFAARNGCEIERWNRHAFLFGGLAAGTD
jgi:hypothetical protein